jgi:hypothetical protein
MNFYPGFGIRPTVGPMGFEYDPMNPIYSQFDEDPAKFLFVPQPQIIESRWRAFIP